jgi:AbrB family looped-hinge helix DNA binding protein
MDKEIGIIKKVDKLGRIVIPKEMRERFNISTDVEISVTENGILIRNPEFVLVKKEDVKA